MIAPKEVTEVKKGSTHVVVRVDGDTIPVSVTIGNTSKDKWRAAALATIIALTVIIVALVVFFGTPQQAQMLADFLRNLLGYP
jgi:hypothetical protein